MTLHGPDSQNRSDPCPGSARGLIVILERGSYGVSPRLVVFTRVLLVPLVLTLIGLALDKVWSRCLSFSAAVADSCFMRSPE